MKIKLVLTDVDGCLTDGSVIYGPNHEKYKKFNMQDGMALKLLRDCSIQSGIITSDNSLATKYRAEDLGFDYICINVSDKLEQFYKILDEVHLLEEEVAYMGDDIQDLPIIEKVGFSCAPANAVATVKNTVNYITSKSGGDGAFREFIEYIVEKNKGEL